MTLGPTVAMSPMRSGAPAGVVPGIGFRERPAEHGEVLRKNVDQPALDSPVASDESVAVDLLLRHAEVVATVGDELVGLLERALIEQELHALAGRHFAFFMLPLATLGTSAILGELVPLFQFGHFLFEVHGRKL